MIDINHKEEAEKKWKDLYLNGQKVAGLPKNFTPDCPPVWFNEKIYRQSQKLAKTYFDSIFFGHLTGLLFSVYHSEAYNVLSITGNSENVPKLYRRYLSTLLHVMYWNEYNPFDKTSKAYKSLKQVRGLHRQVSEKMNKQHKKIEGKDILFLNQYSMVLAQFSFIGILALYPKQCGLHTLTDEEFYHLLYMWRVLGYCNGIEDRFNLCSGSKEEIIELCQIIFNKTCYPLISSESPQVMGRIEMSKGICLALSKIAVFLNWNIFMKYWYPILNVQKPISLNTTEKFWFSQIKFCWNYMSKSSLHHCFLSSIIRLLISFSVRNRDRNYKLLSKQYNDITYGQNCCPFNVNTDSNDVFDIK